MKGGADYRSGEFLILRTRCHRLKFPKPTLVRNTLGPKSWEFMSLERLLGGTGPRGLSDVRVLHEWVCCNAAHHTSLTGS